MTIDEAIKTLSDDMTDLTIYQVPDFIDAIKLGIEALKRERRHRDGLLLTKPELLPGETKD